jgi:hypothetical protein
MIKELKLMILMMFGIKVMIIINMILMMMLKMMMTTMMKMMIMMIGVMKSFMMMILMTMEVLLYDFGSDNHDNDYDKYASQHFFVMTLFIYYQALFVEE